MILYKITEKHLQIILKGFIIYAVFLCINQKKAIQIDNMIKESIYEDNINFSETVTKYRVLAIYYQLVKFNKSLIKEEILLAKNHGIFGFGIVYNFLIGIKTNNEILNFFSYENEINFPYFIILNYAKRNEKCLNNDIIFKNEDKNILINDIDKFFISENYIKLEGKPILGILYPFPLMSNFISYIREYEIEQKKQSIYIISISNGISNLDYSKISNMTNSIIDYPCQYKHLNSELNKIYFYNYNYYNLIKPENLNSKNIKNFLIFNGCHPEKFYIIFKKYLNTTNFDSNSILLFNAWNNHKENSYLEPNEEFGYSYLNYFSKAIFNINDDVIYNLETLNNKCKVAVQVHLIYEDLSEDIINKTNNIPVKFDLFISTIDLEIYKNLQKSIKKYSRANHFEILIVENKGRDILPFLNQIRKRFRHYKYLCHIHSKKSKHSKVPNLGILWRNYLYNNLLGNADIINEILYDFENNDKLGFIFPETYHKILQPFYNLTDETKSWMNFISSKLFPNYKIGKLINYPGGDMFWARVEAIFQIFTYDLNSYFPEEKNQTNDTIMHGIERIWLYIVKYNGFFYKTIFKWF